MFYLPKMERRRGMKIPRLSFIRRLKNKIILGTLKTDPYITDRFNLQIPRGKFYIANYRILMYNIVRSVKNERAKITYDI